ncbi:galactose-1-phosphate uridylyltransferase [Modestobacter marinus]|uniref:Galactose-1-phosphate uridylyltransferase n=1 Tax=Modestobacter marinus TaxID=477641 RepID=A0A846LNN5_9ACTN|nr:galactose-1-phosphate uridylyltransferase [Modestobacter marinus]NIH67802.1 UDPglucose--hexose-1-phosphate uridylyltransferase [Modestobacter marinus]GGL71193.1 galactose-1-phosphate uridylyltransferase [Modestobacter marinus]
MDAGPMADGAQRWPGQVTERTLADGRPILYFDDEATAGPVHETADDRPLLEAPRAGEVRYDVLTGEWVTIAGHRMNRTFLPSAADCPLDPTVDPARPTEVPDSGYDVAVFANRFPSFAPLTAGPVEGAPAVPFGPPDAPAYGHCDVVVFSSDHDAAVVDLPAARMRTIVEAWAQRTAAHSADPGVAEVFVFENSGQEIGVTLTHPHGQVYAYPVVAPRTGQLLEQARRHREATGGNLLADVLAAEQAEGTRVVLAGEHFTAYVPRAARWPVEVHLAPHRDVPDLAALDDAERAELAEVYQELLRRVNRFHPGVDQVPYISGWHQAPTGAERDLGRLHLQLFSLLRAPGKLKYLAGSESGMGAWINDTTPERIAERLREVAS